MLKRYLHSWKDPQLWKFLLFDLLFVIYLVLISSLFMGIFNQQSALVMTTFTPESFQAALESSSPEEAKIILSELRSLFLVIILGGLFITSSSLLLFSYLQAYIWNRLAGKSFNKKKFWKWNLLNLVLLVFFMFYLLFVYVIRLITNYLYFLMPNSFAAFIFDMLILALIVIFLIFVFINYHNFVHSYKLWESIGDSFHRLKANFKKLTFVFIHALATLLLMSLTISLILYLVDTMVKYSVYLNLFFMLLFISWMRIYLARRLPD